MLTILALAVLTAILSCRVIDVNHEHLVTLAQLAKRLPRRRQDRPVHPATVHRWRNPGVRGIRLECVRIGGIWMSTLEAFQRWCQRLTELEPTGGVKPDAGETTGTTHVSP